ncbi:MAG TPA: DNA-3-methyladenine glycosylase [Luteimonas sp.]|nr:DNA-3-methyladenine glycosylase [Luteimonas sp.]
MASASVRAGKRLPRAFYRRDPREVAPDLLNKVLVAADGRRARIVETEAYCGPIDAAAHTYRGQTPRNAVMFGAPGLLYVYFTYGMHYCCNAVCGEEGEGVAVLLRAAEPLAGLALMREARPAAKRDRDLCSGPARLCQALGIGRAQDGVDLVTGAGGYGIVDDGVAPPEDPMVTTRIGIRHAAEEPWRWYVPGNPNVSRR